MVGRKFAGAHVNWKLAITAAGLVASAASSAGAEANLSTGASDGAFQGVRLWQFQASRLDGVGQADSLGYERSTAGLSAENAHASLAAPRPDGKPVHLDIRADHLSVLTKENRGVWKGHVRVVRPGTAGQPELRLFCDQLVTTLSGADRLQDAVCTGNVQVVQGDRAGWGDTAVYLAETAQVVVTGNPHGQQGPSTFRGEKLTFGVETGRIEVEKPVLETPAPRSASAEPVATSGGAR